MRNLKVSLLIFLAIIIGIAPATAQLKIEKENVLEIPENISDNLLGIRVSGEKAYIANKAGKFISFNFSNSETINGQMRSQVGIVDFAVFLGQMVYLQADGKLNGKIRKAWPKKSYEACNLDILGEGAILSGGRQFIFLEKNATDSLSIAEMGLVYPIQNGFIWNVRRDKKSKNWLVDLFDCYGNLMKNVYTFSESFKPSGLQIGPATIEKDVLLSFYSKNKREVCLMAQNGHMLWRINAAEKVCKRDLAFDPKGNLLTLEKTDNKIYLVRYRFEMPQG